MSFTWNEGLSLSDETIDKQHRYLIELNASFSKNTIDTAEKTVMKLYKYTIEHFSSEEKQMKKINYPGLKAHSEIHDNLITKLNSIVENHLSSPDDIDKFKAFFDNWICEHIMNEDMKYKYLL